jgi:hypothetical protein
MGSQVNNVFSIDPYKEGQKAFRDGKTWQDSPYAHMALSPHFYQWMCGWDDASLEPRKVTGDHVHLSRANQQRCA